MAKKRMAARRARKSGAGSRRTKSRPATRRAAARRRRLVRRKPAASRRRAKAPARRATPRRAARPQPARRVKAKPVKTRESAKPTRQTQAPKRVQRTTAPRTAGPARQPRLERDRRRLPETERLNAAKDMSGDRLIASARSGHDEMRSELQRHTEASPTLTAGDVDAKWQDAYAIGDEAPGGDNPTPDQDRVDDIGKALGVQYQDNEELKGGDEIVERDHKRWELDPASSDDWPHKE